MIRFLRSAAVLAAVAPSAVAAQLPDAPTGIRGIVASAAGVPLPFAQIRLRDGRWIATADEQGRFEILGVSAGTHRLAVRRIGYAPLLDEAKVQTGRITDYRLELEPIPLAAPAVTIRAKRHFIGAVQVADQGAALAEANDFSVRQYIERSWPWLRLNDDVGPSSNWINGQPAVFPQDWNGWHTALGQAELFGLSLPQHAMFVPVLPGTVPLGRGAELQQRASEALAGCPTFVNGACVPEWYLDAIAPSDLETLSVQRQGRRYIVVMMTRTMASTN